MEIILLWPITALLNLTFLLIDNLKDNRKNQNLTYGMQMRKLEQNLIYAIMGILPVVSTIVTGLILVNFLQDKKHNYQKKQKEKKIENERKWLEENGDTIHFLTKMIQQLEKEIEATVSLTEWGHKNELQKNLIEAKNRIERNKHREEIQKLDMQYQEVIKNSYKAMKETIQINGRIASIVVSELTEISETLKEDIEKAEEKLLDQVTNRIEFEKEYLRKKM